MYKLGGRIYFKEITDSEEDTDCVVKWRNTDSARESFFIKDVVTPDTHRLFIKNKLNNDIVFMAYNEDKKRIGMTAIIVDIKNFTGEYGRTFIDSNFRGNKYAEETEILLMSYAFDILNLNSIWLDAFTTNEAIIKLHHKTGWKDAGINLNGHTHERGDILTMECSKETWNTNKEKLFNNLPKSKKFTLMELEKENIKNGENI
jgi:RimJ/RimL family protein N-acetyltransferase